MDISEVSDEALGGKRPFARTEVSEDAKQRVVRATCEVMASCSSECPPRGSGTGVYIGIFSGYGRVFATAAHVVAPYVGSEPWPCVLVRPSQGDVWLEATVRAFGTFVDLALVSVNESIDGVSSLPLAYSDEGYLILPSTTRVAYAGYPIRPESIGVRQLVFAQGMIAGATERADTETGETYPIYVVDGMVNAGMSGGPVFCPDTGLLAGIMIETVTPSSRHVGHGWGHAVPVEHVMDMMRQLEEGAVAKHKEEAEA